MRVLLPRVLRAPIRPAARVMYSAHCGMSVPIAATSARFLARVGRAVARS